MSIISLLTEIPTASTAIKAIISEIMQCIRNDIKACSMLYYMNVSEVLSTYVYRLGLINSRYDFSTAVNLFTSVVNCTMLVAVNAISRKVSDHSLW